MDYIYGRTVLAVNVQGIVGVVLEMIPGVHYLRQEI
jgi:hypothetical protein